MGTYSADQVNWLRPPEVEGEHGNWQSRWLLTTVRLPVNHTLELELHSDLQTGTLTHLERGELRLDLRTSTHPLDPEGYAAIDAVLHAIHDAFEIIRINGAARTMWRPFRDWDAS